MRLLLLLPPIIILSMAASCDPCGDNLVIREIAIPLTVDKDLTTLAVGDTLWVSGTFSREQEAFTIAPSGGLLSFLTVELNATGDSVFSAEDAFETLTARGSPLTGDVPTASYLIFACEEDDCGYRQGLILNRPGRFLLQPLAGEIDLENIINCGETSPGAFFYPSPPSYEDLGPVSFPLELDTRNVSLFLDSSPNFDFTAPPLLFQVR